MLSTVAKVTISLMEAAAATQCQFELFLLFYYIEMVV